MPRRASRRTAFARSTLKSLRKSSQWIRGRRTDGHSQSGVLLCRISIPLFLSLRVGVVLFRLPHGVRLTLAEAASDWEVTAQDFDASPAGRVLRELAVVFLQLGGSRLLHPFTQFVENVVEHKEVYNPPVHDGPIPFDPTFRFVLGGQLSVDRKKKGRSTKMNFASGRVGTAPEFIAELITVQEGSL